jgi:hypothetical protein
MPAYRSEAEAEVRAAVVARLRLLRPNARIMNEVNVAGQGSNRIDVLAVDRAEIIAVEIKSAKDKIDRLSDQVKAMQGCAHQVIAALHDKFLTSAEHDIRIRNPETGFYEKTGTQIYFRGPDVPHGVLIWAYPETQRQGFQCGIWAEPKPRITIPLPPSAINILWADELRQLCAMIQVSLPPRPNMDQMISALRWRATGEQITKGICAMLRARHCIEADPPIELTGAQVIALGARGC